MPIKGIKKLSSDQSIGFGIGIGTIQSIAFVKYLPGQLWPVFGNIVIGLGALWAGAKKYKTGSAHNILTGYGYTVFIGGLVSGIMSAAGWAARAKAMSHAQARAMAQRNAMATSYNGYLSSSYYPGVSGTFVRRPQSRARGFASDVTINPMASIPTQVYYEKKIIA